MSKISKWFDKAQAWFGKQTTTAQIGIIFAISFIVIACFMAAQA